MAKPTQRNGARTTSGTTSNGTRPRRAGVGAQAWSERHLDAYLITRDTLRRVRAMAWLTSDDDRTRSEPASRN